MSISTTVAKASGPAGLNSCRVSERFVCDVPVNCHPPTSWGGREIKWQARLTNVSSGGLNLILRRRFEPGTGLSIDVPEIEGVASRTILARVLHVRRDRDRGGMWQLGCSFVGELSDEELAALQRVAAAQEGEAPAKGETSTQGTHIYGVYFRGMLPDGGFIDRYIRVLNVGKNWPVPTGRMLGLRFRGPNGETPVVRVEVVSCQSTSQGWILDCTFVGAPSTAFLSARTPRQANR